MLCFDHRGMGLSTPITAATVLQEGSVDKQAEYLKHFRADSAVKDLEAIRKCLTADYAEEKRKWSVMGQSYGGFVALTYLSNFPEGLREVFTCGGLAPVTQKGPDQVYRRLFQKAVERNRKYYAKFPEDRERVKRILDHLREKKGVQLPAGGLLTPQRFMSLGIGFGVHGGLDGVHGLVLRTANDLETLGFMTRPTLSKIDDRGAFDDQPLYAVLHEPIYCQGHAPNWSSTRILEEFPAFNLESQAEEVFFAGEVVLRSDFETYPELRQLLPVANVLAATSDWSDLYDIEQLKRNQVPVYSATYVDDMYVDFGFAQETAALVKGCKTIVTNALYHDAVRSKTEDLCRSLFALREDSID